MVRKKPSLAQQVILEILADINAEGIVRDIGALPSEAELSQRFQVSSPALRDALSKLELAGRVIRRQGVGTFVNLRASHHPATIRDWVYEASSFIDMIRSANHKAETMVIESQVRPAGEIAGWLEIVANGPELAIEKFSWSPPSRPSIMWISSQSAWFSMR